MIHLSVAAGMLLAGSAAFAASAAKADVMTTVPSSSLTVTDWYKQDVYDQSNTKSDRSWTRWSVRTDK
jgi:hypothetical protein